MQVRFPKWDFSRIHPHWAPDHEFAQMQNAASTVPAYLEPYLVKVMQRAQDALGPKHAALKQDLAIFTKQEMQHCRQHLAFNRVLRVHGYDGIAPMEKRFEDDYARLLRTRSLRFNCAYSEGFEAMSAIAVSVFFEEYDEYYEGADTNAVDLWKWHLAEEYEHREVAHKVYYALFGRRRLSAYLYRIYGFFYAVTHIRRHVQRVQTYLLERDRATMTAEQRIESLKREKRVKTAMKRRAMAHLKDILSPGYDPAERAAPRGVHAYLARFQQAAA